MESYDDLFQNFIIGPFKRKSSDEKFNLKVLLQRNE